ncbi:mitochondrial 54S ribosomal protein mL57 [Aspergillus lucknowensis]|uniref:Ribonuclease-III-like-domain-containing protein n=1 Tax=Aspergillus lucknowensis TaxID=176173 RepID=A0ABR4LNX6_9EURO
MASLLPARATRTVSCSAYRSVVRPSSAQLALPLVRPSSAQLALPLVRRNYSTPAEEEPVDYASKPRWSYTPPRAKAPFSLHYNSRRPEFPVNSDPQVLDRFYVGFLGPGGENVLNEETKWLAVTHKSFDQGRRGFNDRLAFLGKRIVCLQASLALVQSPPNSPPVSSDAYGREPFAHPALEGLPNLTMGAENFALSKENLAALAQEYKLPAVVRWSPRKPHNLHASGVDLVLAHTLYALIGAIALEKGGQVANKVARERILQPLGFKVTG